MEQKLFPFYFFSTGLAGIGVSIVLVSSKKYLSQNLYLSLCVCSLALCSLYNFCYIEGLLQDVPFLFIIAKAIIYLVAPCAYLYIRNIFAPENLYRQYDWIHFLPFAIVILALTNISLRNPAAIQNALNDSSVNWFVNVSHAEIYYYLSIGKCILWLFYTVLQSLCIINFEQKKDTRHYHYNYRLINWAKTFNITLIVLFSSLLIQRLANITFISLDFVNDTTMSLILLLTVVFLIFNPHILYSLEHNGLYLYNNSNLRGYLTADAIDDDDKESNTYNLFSEQKKQEYLLILDDVLMHSKPYLNKGLSLRDLSKLTDIPAHHLSRLISSEFNLHFQDFINLKRIEYLKNNVEEMEWKQLTLEGICWEIGFNSRTTFFRAFIKFTGESPSEYFKSRKKRKSNG